MRRGAARLRAGSILLCACLAAALSACAEDRHAQAIYSAPSSVSPFQRALFKDYAYLVRSLKDHDTGMGSETLAAVFARKAENAAAGRGVAPESAEFAASAHARLDQALAAGLRERAPATAARAQASFDCWVLNARVGRQKAAMKCKSVFDTALITAGISFVPASTPAVAAPASYPTQSTVYFDFDEWNLSAEALQTITQAVWAAHDSRAGRIEIAGYTDTSGSAPYNQALSERRAKAVREVMIEMGARPPAVDAEGEGERDPAVPTRDGVREAGNRRSVITLIPMESRVSAR